MAYTQTDNTVILLARAKATPAGDIVDILWNNGGSWQSLLTGFIEVEIDFPLTLAVVWRNTSSRQARGRILVDITHPSASYSPVAVAGQDAIVARNSTGQVQFEPYVLAYEGDYTGSVSLQVEIA